MARISYRRQYEALVATVQEERATLAIRERRQIGTPEERKLRANRIVELRAATETLYAIALAHQGEDGFEIPDPKAYLHEPAA